MIWNLRPYSLRPRGDPDGVELRFLPDDSGLPGRAAARDPKLAGRSYADFLRGRRLNWSNRLFFEYSYMRGVRTENLKYVERTKEWPSELYDLEADPGESENVIHDAGYAKVLASLRARTRPFFQDRGAPALAELAHHHQTESSVLSRRARPQNDSPGRRELGLERCRPGGCGGEAGGPRSGGGRPLWRHTRGWWNGSPRATLRSTP